MSKLLQRTFRLVKREGIRDWDAIQSPFDKIFGPMFLCRKTMGQFFAIPAGVDKIIVSLWEHETPDRVAVYVGLYPGSGSVFIGEERKHRYHPALRKWLQPFTGRTLYAQVNYEE